VGVHVTMVVGMTDENSAWYDGGRGYGRSEQFGRKRPLV
jgi:hypothetical protein